MFINKHCQLIAGLTCVLIFTHIWSPAQLPVRGLVAHYKLNGDARDETRFGNHGTVFGQVEAVEDRFGNPCSAMWFDGQTGLIEVKSSASLESPSSQVSISVWVKLEQVDLNNELQWLTICCKSNEFDETSFHPQYRLQTTNVTISLNTAFTEPHNQVLLEDVWHHYVLVYDGNEVKTYLDNQQIFSFPFHDFLFPSDSPLEIGRDRPGEVEYFLGEMDDLRIYNRALTAVEVSELFREKEQPFNYQLTLTCPPNMVVQAPSNKCEAYVTYPLPRSASECSQPVVELVEGKGSGSNFSVGVHEEKYEASLANQPKEKCSFTITVKEKSAYRLVCPNDTVIWVKSSEKGEKYAYGQPYVKGGCENLDAVRTSGQKSGAFFPVGRNTVVWKAEPRSASALHCSFTVDVKRESPPVAVKKPAPPKKVTPKPDPSVVVKTDPPVPKKTEPAPVTPAPDPSLKIERTFAVKTKTVRLYLYDHQKQDGDIVSINFNGEWILDQYTIKKKKKNFDKNKYLDITFPAPGEYILYSKAWNLGKTPPNTLTVELHDPAFGYKPRVFQLNSDIGISDGIRLVYEPK